MFRPILRAACAPFAVVAPAAAAEAPPLPPAPSPLAAIEAIEAADFVERDTSASADRFALLALSLDLAAERGREDMAAIEAIESRPRAHGRSHGLEWAYEQQFVDADRLRQAAALLRALAPHEAKIRALLVSGA